MASTVTIQAILNTDKVISGVNGIKGSLNGLSTSVDNTSGKTSKLSGAFDMLKIAAGNVLANAISSAFRTITGSIDDAISRVDTLNQFPKVMQNIGFSAEDAEESIQKMSDGIEGLPTTLDEIVSNTQMLALSIGDLDTATDVALALNDGFIAFGASSADVTNSITQLNQMITAGKYDMQSWNSINQAAPGFLDTVARSMLGEEASASQLRDALNDGSVSSEEFLDAIVDLDQNGSDSVTAFSQAAQDASGGIQTSMNNAKNAVIKNVANIIDSFNETGAVQAVFDDIKLAINYVGDAIGDLAGDWGDTFSEMVPTTEEFADILDDLSDHLDELATIVAAVVGAFAAWKIGTLVAEIAAFAGEVALAGGGLSGLLAVLEINPFVLLATAIAAVVAALVWFFTQTNTGRELLSSFCEAVSGFFMGLWESLVSIWTSITETVAGAITAIGTIILGIAETIGTVWDVFWQGLTTTVTIVWETIQLIISTALEFIQVYIGTVLLLITSIWQGDWETVFQVLSAVWEAIQQVISMALEFIFTTLSTVLESIKNAWETAWDSVKTTLTTVWDNIKTAVETAISSVKSKISSTIASIKSTWKSGWDNVKSTVKSAISNVVAKVKELPDKILSAFSDAPSLLVSAGEDIIQGLIDGITGMISTLYESIKSALSGLVDTAKKALGIGSPSKVFAELGRWLDEGFAIGIEGHMDVPLEKVEELSDLVAATTFDDLAAGITVANVTAGKTNEISSSKNTTGDAMLAKLNDILEGLTELADMSFVVNIDSKTVARSIASASDKVSGTRQTFAMRGLAL